MVVLKVSWCGIIYLPHDELVQRRDDRPQGGAYGDRRVIAERLEERHTFDDVCVEPHHDLISQ